MFKEHILPENCPPPDAEEPEAPITMFRILPGKEINEQAFLSYRQLYPENKRYKDLCVAFAVSMFTSLDFTLSAWRDARRRNKILGSHIAELAILPEHGKFEMNPVNGHISFWFYETCVFEEIECRQIIAIDENS